MDKTSNLSHANIVINVGRKINSNNEIQENRKSMQVIPTFIHRTVFLIRLLLLQLLLQSGIVFPSGQLSRFKLDGLPKSAILDLKYLYHSL